MYGVKTCFSGLTDHELQLELRETESKLQEIEQLGIAAFMGVAGFMPDDERDLKRYQAALIQEIKERNA